MPHTTGDITDIARDAIKNSDSFKFFIQEIVTLKGFIVEFSYYFSRGAFGFAIGTGSFCSQ